MQLKKALNPTVFPRIVLLLLFPPQKRCRQQGHTSPPSNHAKSRNISKESIFHSALQSIAQITILYPYIISTRLFFNRKTFFCKFSSSKFKISCIINRYNLFVQLLDQFSKKKKLVQKTKEKMCMNDPRKDCRMNLRITVF